jgi:DNA-directed RNA polymerase subunit RPC12/RpoP
MVKVKIVSDAKNVTCPHCSERVTFRRDKSGRWTGRVVGGGIGWWLASGLGIAGGVLGFPVAIAAGVVGLAVGASVGNNVGKKKDDDNAKCPKCSKSLVL